MRTRGGGVTRVFLTRHAAERITQRTLYTCDEVLQAVARKVAPVRDVDRLDNLAVDLPEHSLRVVLRKHRREKNAVAVVTVLGPGMVTARERRWWRAAT